MSCSFCIFQVYYSFFQFEHRPQGFPTEYHKVAQAAEGARHVQRGGVEAEQVLSANAGVRADAGAVRRLLAASKALLKRLEKRKKR